MFSHERKWACRVQLRRYLSEGYGGIYPFRSVPLFISVMNPILVCSEIFSAQRQAQEDRLL